MKPSGLDEVSTAPAGREESARRTVQLNTLMLLIAADRRLPGGAA